MPLPVILALAGALVGGAFGTFGGVKLGAWLKGKLTEDEQRAVAQACSMFCIKSGDDVSSLSPAKQREFAETLEEIRNREHA